MTLKYKARGFVLTLLLLGIAGAARAQAPSFLFGSTERMPTRLFGSSDELGCCATCARTTTFGRDPGCGCAQKSISRPALSLAAVLKRSSDCGCKSACGRKCSSKSACDCAADDGCSNRCGCSCRRGFGIAGLHKAFDKLDGAVERLFHCNRPVCCDPCCLPARYRNVCPPKGHDFGCGCEPAWTPLPAPQQNFESPSMEGDPFEDDPVQPLPPPVPSEAWRRSDGVSPLRAVHYLQPVRQQSDAAGPSRLDSRNPVTPMTKREQLTQSMLDCLD